MLLALPGHGLQLRLVPLVIFIMSATAALALGLVISGESVPVNDKLLHFGMFFLMSFSAYWILDLSRRRAIQLTSAVMLVGSIGSEFAQSLLTTRQFDTKDIAANLVGSACGVA